MKVGGCKCPIKTNYFGQEDFRRKLCLAVAQSSSWLDVAGIHSTAYFAVRLLQSTVAWVLSSQPKGRIDR